MTTCILPSCPRAQESRGKRGDCVKTGLSMWVIPQEAGDPFECIIEDNKLRAARGSKVFRLASLCASRIASSPPSSVQGYLSYKKRGRGHGRVVQLPEHGETMGLYLLVADVSV